MPQAKLIVAAFMLALTPAIAFAASQCSLGAPRLEKDQLTVALQCAETRTPTALVYPKGPLFVGATLFKLAPALRGKTAPYEDSPDIQSQDLPFQTFEITGAGIAKFSLAGLAGYTHVLVAVWDQKNPCEGEFDEASACGRFHFTLGRVDADSFPIPVDAWPRPICDKEKLKRAGFFKWSKDGDPSGATAPPDLERYFLLNDCFREVEGPGLGYSVRRWRVGPLPRSE